MRLLLPTVFLFWLIWITFKVFGEAFLEGKCLFLYGLSGFAFCHEILWKCCRKDGVGNSEKWLRYWSAGRSIYLWKVQLKVIQEILVRRGRNTAENVNALGNWWWDCFWWVLCGIVLTEFMGFPPSLSPSHMKASRTYVIDSCFKGYLFFLLTTSSV